MERVRSRIGNMRFYEKLPYRRLAVSLASCAMAALVWWLATKPVLFHSHILATEDDRLCNEYNSHGTGVPILNPFRSRRTERMADALLRAASSAECLSDWDEKMCMFVKKHPLPAGTWRLVNRWDSATTIGLFYRLEPQERAERKRCVIAEVELRRTGATWRISSFGLTPAHFCPG
jgi:hypothetical protein